MGRYVSAIPAYGRDYKSARAVKEAWNEGKDFLIQDFEMSGYINKSDLRLSPGLIINIRYDRKQKVYVIK